MLNSRKHAYIVNLWIELGTISPWWKIQIGEASSCVCSIPLKGLTTVNILPSFEYCCAGSDREGLCIAVLL